MGMARLVHNAVLTQVRVFVLVKILCNGESKGEKSRVQRVIGITIRADELEHNRKGRDRKILLSR